MAVAAGGGTADHDWRAEWLALAARAVRADQAAKATRPARPRSRNDGAGGTTATDRAIARGLAQAELDTRPAARAGNRPAARAAARSAVRTAERTAVRARPGSAAGFLVLLILGSLYGLGMAVVTAVAVARFATTQPLGAVGPVAFFGVALGFIVLAALVLPSVRVRRDDPDD